jgi:hypothetical protein
MARKKKKKHISMIIFASALGAFILYVTVFSLIPISADSPSYLIATTRTAVKIKLSLINDHAYYSFALIFIVAIVMPVYLKFKN